MNNTYIIREKSITKALDNISEFQDKIKVFLSKHKDFKYNISLETDDEGCIIRLNIRNDNEQNNPEIFKEITEGREIL